MTIVPIGKLVLLVREGADRKAYLRGLTGEMKEAVKDTVPHFWSPFIQRIARKEL